MQTIKTAVLLIVLIVVFKILQAMNSVIMFLVEPILVITLILVSLFLIYLIYEYLYFKSIKFKTIKDSIYTFMNNCNKLNHHIEELKCSYINIKSFNYGTSSMEDESNFNFKRREWDKNIQNSHIHNCSSSVCKSASNQPIKYLCKYFDIKISENSLSKIESILNNFAAAEEGKLLLQRERDSILNDIESSIPWLINNFSKKKFIKNLGFEDIDLSDLYFHLYTFQYISPGGNSSMKCDIKLNLENLEKLISYLRRLIDFRKSVEGQRALMTLKLREKIKTRDDYTCQICAISIRNEC